MIRCNTQEGTEQQHSAVSASVDACKRRARLGHVLLRSEGQDQRRLRQARAPVRGLNPDGCVRRYGCAPPLGSWVRLESSSVHLVSVSIPLCVVCRVAIKKLSLVRSLDRECLRLDRLHLPQVEHCCGGAQGRSPSRLRPAEGF